MTLDAVFVRDGEHYRATELALGPWYETALHGGAPAALLAHAIMAAAPDPTLRLARLTCEFVRPVSLGELSARAEVIRPGRRVSLLDAFLLDGDGTEVTRARALLLRPSTVDAGAPEPPPFPGPEDGRPNDFHRGGGRPMFATHAMEIRFVEGAFQESGPATAWFRLRHPLVAGEAVFRARRRRRRRRLRQRDRLHPQLGGAPVHQSRSDPVHRTPAGRRVGGTAGSDSRAARTASPSPRASCGIGRAGSGARSSHCWSTAAR